MHFLSVGGFLAKLKPGDEHQTVLKLPSLVVLQTISAAAYLSCHSCFLVGAGSVVEYSSPTKTSQRYSQEPG